MRIHTPKHSLQFLLIAFCICIWVNETGAQTARATAPRLTALAATPGKPSVFEIAFVTSETLTSTAEFVVDFPQEFDLSQLQIAGSPEITGGFTLTREKQKVRVKRSGLGQSVAAGTFVRLRLGVVVNPISFETSTAVAVHLRASAQSALTALTQQRVTFQASQRHE